MSNSRTPFIIKLPSYFFLLSMLFGVINFIMVGDTDPSTRWVAETSFTVWVFLSVFFLCLSLVFFGINFMRWKEILTPHSLMGISMVLAGLSFITVVVSVLVLGGDLNAPISLVAGGVFMVSVVSLMISGLRA